MRSPVGESLRETSTIVSSTVIVRRRKSMCRGRRATSSPHLRPVSMAVMTIALNRSGICARTDANSSGVSVRAFRATIFGSSVSSLGLKAMIRSRTLTPDEFASVLAQIPDRFRAMVMTAIETGLRWGELVALRPRHIDFLRRTITVEETIVEVSRKDSPTGERMIVKPYPKDDEPRTLRVSQELLDTLAARIPSAAIRAARV